jgi:GNAT superfamily N-acetyltransferase
MGIPMIRRATMQDIELVARLGHAFISEADEMPDATLVECVEFAARLLSSETGCAFVSEKGEGIIAGVIAPLYYKPSYKLAAELFWRANDGTGLQLLSAFEGWAWSQGANDVRLSTLAEFSDPLTAKLLKRRGYAPYEHHYVKERRP